MSIGEIIAEPLAIHGLYPGRREQARRIGDLVEMVAGHLFACLIYDPDQ